MIRRWLYSRWTIGLAAATLGLIIAGSGWFLAARYGESMAPRPTTLVATPTPTPGPAMSAGRVPDAPLKVPAGYSVRVYAERLGTARDLVFSPGGVLLVSDPGAGTVTALPDGDRNGLADRNQVVLRAGNNPHGLAFYGGYLFVAQTERVARYRWDEAKLTATFDRELFKLPANRNHNRRSLVITPNGQLFVSVGSTCNVCNEADERSATVMTSNTDGANVRIYARGLRNAPFLALHPTSGDVWATEMGRDNLGDNLPPDEINIVRDGANYGWPICYGDRVHDTNFDQARYFADPCAKTVPPLFSVPAHNAPLGLAFIKSSQWPADAQGDLLVAYHGSWNRSVPDGYKVVRLNVEGNRITGSEDVITGFINGRTVAARPVDVTFDAPGNLYVSDDKTGTIYIVQKQ